jgi:hypothetical protein
LEQPFKKTPDKTNGEDNTDKTSKLDKIKQARHMGSFRQDKNRPRAEKTTIDNKTTWATKQMQKNSRQDETRQVTRRQDKTRQHKKQTTQHKLTQHKSITTQHNIQYKTRQETIFASMDKGAGACFTACIAFVQGGLRR